MNYHGLIWIAFINTLSYNPKMPGKTDLSLYLVTDRSQTGARSLEQIVEAAIAGGVTIVQLREKRCNSREFYDLAISLKPILKFYRVPLIINDRVDIALACHAEGVHIGQHDLPYSIVRQVLGNERIIGLSVENILQAEEANQWDVDYIGVSPVFSTPTKTDTAPPLGLEGLREITRISKHPAVAIGGINLENTREIITAGADGVAVVSAIMSSENVTESASRFKTIIEKTQYEKNI